MDSKLILIILAVLAGAVALGWLTSGGGGPATLSQQASPAPVINAIEFPPQIPASGDPVQGLIRFSDPEGDLAEARFEVLEAVAFENFSLDLLGAAGITRGNFTFEVHSTLDQEIVLRVILIDAMGHESEPITLRFRAVGQQGAGGGP